MKQLRKINQLNNVESFIQVDFMKGYKYIDKAGELVNRFHTDNLPPKFLMSLDGLVISNPDKKISEIKISSLAFWAHFLKPDSLDQISQLFEKKLVIVDEVLQPEGCSRVGWRNYFIFETNKSDRDIITKKLVPSASFDFNQLGFSVKLGRFENTFNITTAVKKNDPGVPAFLFDVDTFIRYKTGADISQVKKDLKGIWEMLGGKDFIQAFNLLIDKN